MSEVTKRLRDRRLNVWEDAKKLADVAADENRAFNGEEQSQWDTLNAELDALDKRIKAVIDGEQRAKDTEEAFNRLEGRGRQDRELPGNDTLEDEFRSFLKGEGGRAFEVQPEGRTDYRTLSKSVSAGTLVPVSFYDRLVEHMIEVSGLLQAGPTILRTASGENITIPKTTAHSSGSQIAESAVNVASEPTFGVITLGAYKYSGGLIQVSRELIDDSGVDLLGYLARQAGRAAGNDIGEDLITGTGSTMPRGLSVDAGTASTGPLGVTGGFGTQSVVGQGFDLVIDTFHGVISPYRNSSSCAWLMADLSAAHVRKVKNADGDYIWIPSVQPGLPDTILGKPVFIDPWVPAKGTAAKWILFGDMSQYFVRFAGGIRFERSDEYAFNTDLVTFRCLLRGDGALVDTTGAVKAFRGGTA